MTPTFLEDHVSQIPALQLLVNMGYSYLSPSQALELRKGKTSQVLLESVLKSQLQKINRIEHKGQHYPFSESNINNALLAIKNLPINEGFIKANEAFYNLLTLGKAFEQTIEGDKKSHTIQYIDWQNPENNIFHVSEEMSVLRSGRSDHYRPDIVLFINGMPIVVIECKSSALKGTKSPTELAVEQHLRNSSVDGIRDLYIYSALLLSIAGNSGSYATTGTKKEFWSVWKEQFVNPSKQKNYINDLKILKNTALSPEIKKQLFAERKYGFSYVKPFFDSVEKQERLVTEQDKLLFSLCQTTRLLELLRNFTLYDNGIKKVARYQQYFAIQATAKRVAQLTNTGKRTGGVIWHTQGSGKSLTMVMMAQMLVNHPQIKNPKIVLVTDRVDLDKQISTTFEKCDKTVENAKTGSDLVKKLQSSSDAVITTIINKFESAVKQSIVLESPNIFILIDEGHRTQYGTFNTSMRQVFPNACFLAFTGTPLMKKERSTASKFGGYIGIPYTVTDAVADGAVVPLLYEGRHNNLKVDAKPLNHYFQRIVERKNLTQKGETALKRKFNSFQELIKSDKFVQAVANDISDHYVHFHQTKGDQYKPKAQLVAPRIETALLYKYYLDEIGDVSSAVVVTPSDSREGTEDAFYNTNELKDREAKYLTAEQDKHGSLKQYEENTINQFKNDENPEILIVVAKLLTGFDAPCNTVLYLCRSLKEHTLLQAIARVNRVFPGKEFGYIIDYVGNLENLDIAIDTYSGLNEDFDESELEGTFTKLNDEIKKLPQAHAEIWDIFDSLSGQDFELSAYEALLKPEDIRNDFYTKVSRFAKLLKMALSSVNFMNDTDQEKIKTYKKDAKTFLKLRASVMLANNDDIDYKELEPKIQKLINQHLASEGEVIKITQLINVFDQAERDNVLEQIEGTKAKADHIASRTTKAINLKMHEDPIFFKKIAELIQETIDAFNEKRISEAELLQQLIDLENQTHNGRTIDVPEELEGKSAALSFYDQSKNSFPDDQLKTSKFHIQQALIIDECIVSHIFHEEEKLIEWQNNDDVLGKMRTAIGDAIYDHLIQNDIAIDWDIIDHLTIQCIEVSKAKYA